jgi:hypothetical protein
MPTEETLLGALFQRREPQGGRPVFGSANDPSGQTPAAASVDCLGGMSSARTQGFAPAPGPAARQRPSGRGRVAPGESREAAEEVGPRRGHQAHGRNERSRCPKGCRTQRTRSRSNASKSSGSFGPCYFRRPATGSGEHDHPEALQRQGGHSGGGDTVRLRAGGTLRRVEASRGTSPSRPGTRSAPSWRWRWDRGSGLRETRRTPGPAAGCNKPAVLRAEQAGEVVRNHEVGTRGWRVVPSVPWLFGAAGSGRESGSVREWTRVGDVGGGAVVTNPRRGRVPVCAGRSFGSVR